MRHRYSTPAAPRACPPLRRRRPTTPLETLSVRRIRSVATTTYVYDDLNRKITETRPTPDGNPAHAPVLSFEYDARGAVVSGTDARGGEKRRSSTTVLAERSKRHLRSRSVDIERHSDHRYDVRPWSAMSSRLPTRAAPFQPAGTTRSIASSARARLSAQVQCRCSTDGLTATIDSDDHAIAVGDRILVRGAVEDVFNGVFTRDGRHDGYAQLRVVDGRGRRQRR